MREERREMDNIVGVGVSRGIVLVVRRISKRPPFQIAAFSDPLNRENRASSELNREIFSN